MKRARPRLGLKGKFILGSLLIVALVTGLMSSFILYRFKGSLDSETRKRGENLAAEIGARARVPLMAGDRQRLEGLAQKAVGNEDVAAVRFIDESGAELARARSGKLARGQTIAVSYTVMASSKVYKDEIDLYNADPKENGKRVLGAVSIEMSLERNRRIMRGMAGAMAIFAAVMALLAVALSTYLARRVTDPIDRLARGAQQIGAGRLDVSIQVGQEGEIAELAEQFNKMAQNLERSLAQAIEQEKMATLGRMASFMSHEIGSPLNAILFDARAISEDAADEGIGQSAMQIERQAKRIGETVRTFLNFARPPSGEMSPIDIRIPLEEAILLLAGPIRKSGLTLEKNIPEDLPQVMAVKNLLVQVFVNLIANAIDATQPGGRLAIEAWLADEPACEEDKDEEGKAGLAISFHDNGPGIPGEMTQTIFEPFVTTKPEGHGTGLGLSICRQIVESMGCEIVLNKSVSEGAEFIVYLRIAP